MTDSLLTDSEVYELTGFQRAARQSEWLDQNGITHYINGDKKVKVTWYCVNHPYKNNNSTDEPDFRNVA